MKLSEKQREFTLMVAELILFAYARDMELTMGEAFRTDEQQEIHIRDGVSRVDRSKHQSRLAVDLNLFIDGKYMREKEMYRPLGEKWESIGGRWGGRFGLKAEEYGKRIGWDAGHFEYKG